MARIHRPIETETLHLWVFLPPLCVLCVGEVDDALGKQRRPITVQGGFLGATSRASVGLQVLLASAIVCGSWVAQYRAWRKRRMEPMMDGSVDGIGPDARGRLRLSVSWYRAMRTLLMAAAAVMLMSVGELAHAQSFRQGLSAFNRRDYVSASHVFIPLAEQGDPSAQVYLGLMFETGRGVPQNYTEAAMWYRRAAEQGDSRAQYALGLLYDRGQGVPRNIVEASKWLTLAAAAAPPRESEARARIRDAVTSKMSRGEIARARLRAIEWAPTSQR